MPSLLDDPIIGRSFIGFSITPFADFLIIDNNKLTLKKKTFDLKNVDKLLLVKTEVTPWTHDFRLDPYGLIGTSLELYIVDKSGERHILIPKFMMTVHNWGLKKLNRFLSELSKHSGLPLEVLKESKKGHKS
jgi:hypothetical protein